jgi:hypothetical protein
MKHSRFFLTASSLLVVLGLVVFSIGTQSSARSSSGQVAQRDRDLSTYFSKFEIARLDADAAARTVAQGQRLVLSLPNRQLEIDLSPHDLRSSNYRASETGTDGPHDLTRGPVTTFKGSIVGQPNTRARFTLDGSKIEGLILDGDREYFVESARRYSPAAEADEVVFYERADFRAPAELHCEVSGSEKVDRAMNQVAGQPGQPGRTAAPRVVELATEADFEYVSGFGGSVAGANAEILSLMNQVEAIYERDLNLTFAITFQHGWTTADPFTGADQVTFLGQFQAHWNNTFTTVQRDAAHLWTGKTRFQGVGRAFLGVVCRTPTAAYGFNGKVGQLPQEYIIAAHEIGHNLNCSHADQQAGCGDTVMVSSISFTNSGRFCTFSVSEVNAYLVSNSACLATQILSRNRFDFDGDRKTDTTVFRPSTGAWYRINSSNNQFIALQFGQQGDRPVPEDYDGDGRADIAVFRPSGGGWYILSSATGGFIGYGFGLSSDLPVPGDYDGDAKADVAVYRPSTGVWYILNSSNGTVRGVTFGLSQDIPAPGDYDGDGKSDFAVFRGSAGAWFIQNNSDGAFRAVAFGIADDRPVPADYDGDGRSDVALFRPSNGGWYIVNSSNNTVSSVTFGISTDRPVASDFDGDGRADVAVFRSGSWFELLSSNGSFASQTFGSANDLPAPAAYVP